MTQSINAVGAYYLEPLQHPVPVLCLEQMKVRININLQIGIEFRNHNSGAKASSGGFERTASSHLPFDVVLPCILCMHQIPRLSCVIGGGGGN